MLNTTIHEFRALVRHWQEGHDLVPDGIMGPKTRASLAPVVESTGPTPGRRLMNRIIHYALLDIGRGEMGGNNKGPFVRALRRFCGFPSDAVGPWCAIWASAKTKLGLMSLDRPWPSNLLSRGAYRLVMNIGELSAGKFITVPEPGFACWKRKRWLRKREAHIRIITGYDAATDTMHYVAGNEGGKVVAGSLENGAWRKDLIYMSTFS